MKITVTGSLGNISKPLAETLVKAGHEVTIVSSSEDKRQAIESLGAKAAIGSVGDAVFLTQAFTGADAVYTMYHLILLRPISGLMQMPPVKTMLQLFSQPA